MREFIDAAVFRDIILCASAALEQNRQLINELNVFPVPDGDTGTNMGLTMGAAASELGKKSFTSLSAAADCAASAMLRGARGNSGVILSLLFRGLAKRLKGAEKADAKLFAAAMSDGVDAAYKAVMKPAEGTILTVSRVATSAAVEFAEHGSDLELMLSCAVESAIEALADTINLNPVLARAGVVDAGGKGYVFILEAMLSVLRGEAFVPAEPVSGESAEPRERADFSDFSSGEIAFTYCTEFICGRENPKEPSLLRTFLESLGDCVVVVDDDEIIKVHVHTNVPGTVLTEALTYGPLLKVKIENMREQHSEMAGGEAAAVNAGPTVAAPEKTYGAVAVCAGVGMAELFRELGADTIPCIRVYNKSDLSFPGDRAKEEDAVAISAKTGEGIPDLLALIDKKLDKGTKRVTLHLPYDKAGALDSLYREAKVESVEYAATVDVVAVCNPRLLGQLKDYIEGWQPPKEEWE